MPGASCRLRVMTPFHRLRNQNPARIQPNPARVRIILRFISHFSKRSSQTRIHARAGIFQWILNVFFQQRSFQTRNNKGFLYSWHPRAHQALKNSSWTNTKCRAFPFVLITSISAFLSLDSKYSRSKTFSVPSSFNTADRSTHRLSCQMAAFKIKSSIFRSQLPSPMPNSIRLPLRTLNVMR